MQRYNSKRPHASLGYLTPNEVEEAYHQMQG
ncbi:integrase core domain-containing protein [Megasphaera cerevisiae]